MEAAAKPLRLWEIATELEEIGEAIAENGGELTEELEARLEAMAGQFEDKAERIVLYAKECEANALAAQVEADRLAKLKRHFDAKATGLKAYLFAYMQRTGRTSLKTPRARAWTQRNGTPSIRFVGEWSKLPEAFIKRMDPTVDTAVALQEWRAGNALPDGFVVEVGSHLRIG